MSGPIRTGYTLGASARVCHATGRELQTGDAFVAVLAQEAGSESLLRLDFSPGGWQSRPRHILGADGSSLIVLGMWRGVVSQAGHRPRVWLDDASLTELFEQSVQEGRESATHESRAFLFVLALVLARRRLLVIDKSNSGGMNVRIRKQAAAGTEGTAIRIDDPGLDESSIARTAEMLEALLNGDLSALAGASSTTKSTGPTVESGRAS